MCRSILVILLIIQILNNLKAAETVGYTNEKVFIRQSIGVPDDFIALELFKKLGPRYYFIFTNPDDWFTALHKCHTLGGHLINLPDNETLLKVSERITIEKKLNFWTDLNNLSQSGDYVSIHNGQKAHFLNWCDDLDTKIISTSDKCVSIENTNTTRPCMKPISCVESNNIVCESNIPRTLSVSAW